jgi:hypothetical protein
MAMVGMGILYIAMFLIILLPLLNQKGDFIPIKEGHKQRPGENPV